VNRLVLLAPAANVESLVELDYLLARPVVGELASAAWMAAAGVTLAARPLRRLVSSELAIDTGYLGRAGRRLLAPATWGSFVAEQRMLIRELPKLEPVLAQISAPTTIVIGSADRLVPPASAHKLARQIPGAQLVELDRASHLLPQQHARRVAEVIVGEGLAG
jgi:pimeloyl-ACP methyl ester carboxylesterase